MPFMSQFRPPWTSLVIQIVKNPPPVEETQVQPLGQEDPLEKGMATHSSVLAWRVLWSEERYLGSLGLTYTHYYTWASLVAQR